MEYQKIDLRMKKCWRTSRLISLLIFLGIALFLCPITVMAEDTEPRTKLISGTVLAVIFTWRLLVLLIYPVLEYRQWGYYLDEEKVVIRHGIFWVKENIIPIIRIQNVNIKQGPLKGIYEMNTLELQLASGDFVIEGLTREQAEEISNLLKSRLYSRVKERGGLPEQPDQTMAPVQQDQPGQPVQQTPQDQPGQPMQPAPQDQPGQPMQTAQQSHTGQPVPPAPQDQPGQPMQPAPQSQMGQPDLQTPPSQPVQPASQNQPRQPMQPPPQSQMGQPDLQTPPSQPVPGEE